MSRLALVLALALAGCPGPDAATPADPAAPTAPIADPASGGAGDCAPVDLGPEATGAYSVSEGADDHRRLTFPVPPGTRKLLATVTLEKADWDMKFDLGLGECPHRGKSLSSVQGRGKLEIALDAADLEGAPAEMDTSDKWFVHIGSAAEPAPPAGTSTAY